MIYLKPVLLTSAFVFACIENAHAFQKPDISGRISSEVSQQIHKTTSDQLVKEAQNNAPINSKEKIKQIQRLLNKNGFKAGAADGIAGNKTRSAIKQFQQANNLTVDGLATEQLLLKLQTTAP